MQCTVNARSVRALADPHAVAERLAIWSEDARRGGRYERAAALLLAAWEAFDAPRIDRRSGSYSPASARELRHAA